MIDRKNREPLGGSLSNQPSIELHDYAPTLVEAGEICRSPGCFSPRNAGIHIYRRHVYEVESANTEHDWSGAFCSRCGADEASSFASEPCEGDVDDPNEDRCRWCPFPDNDATFHGV